MILLNTIGSIFVWKVVSLLDSVVTRYLVFYVVRDFLLLQFEALYFENIVTRRKRKIRISRVNLTELFGVGKSIFFLPTPFFEGWEFDEPSLLI